MRSLLLKPILYEQTIAGNKTETRRLHGLKEINENPNDWSLSKAEIIADRFYATFTHNTRTVSTIRMIPAKYRMGEELFLAEAHYLNKESQVTKPIIYMDDPVLSRVPVSFIEIFWGSYKKMSPMFLQQIHAREFIRITGFSIERAHDITEEAAKREGITDLNYGIGGITQYRESFMKIWDEINKKMPWKLNPWVFVYHYNYLKERSRR